MSRTCEPSTPASTTSIAAPDGTRTLGWLMELLYGPVVEQMLHLLRTRGLLSTSETSTPTSYPC
jgi:hypothetical protein